jgi:hypothetical protein
MNVLRVSLSLPQSESKSNSGDIQFEEFVHSMVHMVRHGSLPIAPAADDTGGYGSTSATRNGRHGSVTDLFVAREAGQLAPAVAPTSGEGDAMATGGDGAAEDEVCMYDVCMYSICIYVCMHVCMYVCMYVCVYVCIFL